MTIQEAIRSTESALIRTASSTTQLDARLLVMYASGLSREQLLTLADQQLSSKQADKLSQVIIQRNNNTPIAQILGFQEFYGHSFIVNHHVLTPRPESEAILDMLNLEIQRNPHLSRVIDIGTGSGCLAISAKLLHPTLQVTATDVSARALLVARKNAAIHNCDIRFIRQSLLNQDHAHYDIIIANLPYVPLAMTNPSTSKEPARALYAGADGLVLYRKLFKSLHKRRDAQVIITEALPKQHTTLTAIAYSSGYTLHKTDGLVQLFERSNLS